jgi:error-prone DNA polymerase
MGFYSPATIVDDVKRRGVEVRPVEVLRSDWDCTLEPNTGEGSAEHPWAVRMGFRYVKGLGTNEWTLIEAAREEGSFLSIEDFVQRTRLNERALDHLSEAGAFECFGVTRRQAIWRTRGARRQDARTLPIKVEEEQPLFPELDDFETIGWDYRASSHSTRGHPLAPIRQALRAQGLPDAKTIAKMKNGSRARYAGLVICRQRPGTAKGVTFMTLEDETGFVNLVIWSDVFEANRVFIKTTPFIGVTGTIQAEQGVVHLVVERLWKPKFRVHPEQVRSRDFH